MMIVLTPDDFKKLSPSSRQEVLSLIDPRGTPSGDGGSAYYGEERDASIEASFSPDSGGLTSDDVLEEEHVVDLTIDQARELVANISDKSQQTLKRFAVGTPVALEELIGEGRDYRDVTELKRSLVGAVKRRLRTITANRLAVLFSSDRDKTRIRIRPLAAASLRQVLQVPEPMPAFEFFDKASGKIAPEDSTGAKKLRTHLTVAWTHFSGRPENGRASIESRILIKHFLRHGFEVTIGKEKGWDEESMTLMFEFFPANEAPAELLTRMGGEMVEFPVDDHVSHGQVCLSHTELPGIVAMLKEGS